MKKILFPIFLLATISSIIVTPETLTDSQSDQLLVEHP